MISKRIFRVLTAAGLLVGLGGALYGLFRPESSAGAEPRSPTHEVPYLDGKWIRYSPDFTNHAQLEFAEPEQGGLKPEVTVTGTVTFDPERMAAVGSRISGRVRSLLKLEGASVAAGDCLAEIESAELGQAQAAAIAARAKEEASTANEKRERELADAKVSSEREAELAKAQAISARAELSAAEQRVRALGGVIGGAPGILRLTSPIAGRVIERQITRGQSVEATLTAFRVADLSRVWVELAVYERQLPALQTGDPVDVYLERGGKAVPGKVSYVGDVIELETRTAPVRVMVDNPERALRPGQSVFAKIHTSAPVSGALTVPITAVERVDGKPTVFVQHEQLAVEPRSVTLGGQDGQRVVIQSGLAPGERIAISGVLALKSEIFR